ncbi:MAG: HepT-like ribonuclease domain-containing protein [Gallionellaceae bacterium]
MSKTDALRLPEYLRHIIEAIERIDLYVEDMSEITFLEDRKTQDAVIRNFEIIGEASRNIERYHKQFADAHDYLPLGFAYEMRNALSHGYFKVDLEIVWKTIYTNLPKLHEQIKQLLAEIQ